MDSSTFARGESGDTLAASLSRLVCDGGFDEKGTVVVPISAKTGDGVGELALAMRRVLRFSDGATDARVEK